MKKIILTSAIIFATVAASFAQNSTEIQQRTDAATLNVKLNAIQTIEVNSAQKSVNLEYKNKNDYKMGVTSEQQDHLKIYSTGGFFVNVQSDADDIKRANGDETISAATIHVKASAGKTSSLAGAKYGDISLSTTPKDALISSTTGGVDKNFNITYTGMGGDEYVNKYYNDENPTVYTTVVTYTIAAQ